MELEARLLTEIANTLARIEGLLKSGIHNDLFKRPMNKYGETLGEAIQAQIVRGQRGISPHD